ncbi:MAG: hypothetical protein H7099_12715, partial [Gemmatimonadaceae bacterium]|nr:hypothetical protein [Gemmatimonadaceae bacterium]
MAASNHLTHPPRSRYGYQPAEGRTRRYDAPAARTNSRYDAPTDGATRAVRVPTA